MASLRFDPSEIERKMLTMNGIPGYLYAESTVDLERVTRYTSMTEGLKALPVEKKQQLDDLNTVLADPFHAPYIMCISSDPNDLQAKLLAAIIMLAAQRVKGRQALWHTVIGGYKDEMRDKKFAHSKYDLITFANMANNSTDVKYEKLRDLLEMYSDRPRIVTLTGVEPVTFFNYLGYPLNYHVWLRSSRTNRVLGNTK